MKAVRVSRESSSNSSTGVTVSFSGPSVQEIPKPTIGKGELLVKIRASFVQPADILNSKGGFPTTVCMHRNDHGDNSTTFPRTLGKDFAGTVVEGAEQWVGKDVYGTSGSSFSFQEDGGQAEFALLKETAVASKPKNMSFAQAAAIGTPWTTAMITLNRARAKATDTVMVLGATGSVGSSVIQIAKSLGCRTIGVGHHGTDIDTSTDPQLLKAKELTRGAGPDVVVDTVGDLNLTKAAFEVIGTRGRISIISAPRQGTRELPLDLLSLYRRQVELVGCNSAAYPQTEMAQMLNDFTPEFEAGRLVPPDEGSMTQISIDQALDAYSGKIKRAVIVFD